MIMTFEGGMINDSLNVTNLDCVIIHQPFYYLKRKNLHSRINNGSFKLFGQTNHFKEFSGTFTFLNEFIYNYSNSSIIPFCNSTYHKLELAYFALFLNLKLKTPTKYFRSSKLHN